MTPQTLEDVVRGGLCTGCGLCAGMAGDGRIEMRLSPRGDLRPHLAGPLPAADEARILAACPGTTLHGPDPARLEPGTTLDPVWGPVRSLARGWSADAAIRHRAAAGGSLTTLGIFLLETGRVDAVVHVRASPERPLETDAHVSTTRAEMVAGSQSRYGPAAPLVNVQRLLDEGRRFAVAAKPCDITAIRQLGTVDPRVAEQIPYLLTIFCGGAPSVATAASIAAADGVAPEEVSLFRWRGEGWPGPTRVETHDGRAFERRYAELWYGPGKFRYDNQWRCKICPDPIGEVADVSCPDGWVLRDGRPIHEEGPGVNVIVCRTAAGSELIRAAAEAGYLELGPMTHGELDLMHRDHLVRKLGSPARLLALRLGRAASPDVRHYRLRTLLRRAGPRLTSAQLRGALARIRRGDAREPLV